ncbi:hypothetical protein Fmac_032960 [Flemingia macrophylla]|uniref:Uncharacterized protein n=1 Tax=Flemingia macrophylla TaxID=520843 RepID=A0ABD1L6E7_9FABA
MKGGRKRGYWTWYSKEEKQVAEILVELHESESEPKPLQWGNILGNWGLRKKRSAIVSITPSSSYKQRLLERTHCGSLKTLSTPLSIPPTHSHVAPCACYNKLSLKRKASEDGDLEDSKKTKAPCHSENVEEFKKSKEIMNGSTSECEKKGFPLECGWRKQFLASMNENVNVNVKIINSSDSKTHDEKQKQSVMEMRMRMRMPMPMPMQIRSTPSIPMIIPDLNVICGRPSQTLMNGGISVNVFSDFQTTLLQVPNGVGCSDAVPGPPVIPDLNLSPEEESTEMDLADVQPIDEATAQRNLNRSIAAEARMRRALILQAKQKPYKQ